MLHQHSAKGKKFAAMNLECAQYLPHHTDTFQNRQYNYMMIHFLLNFPFCLVLLFGALHSEQKVCQQKFSVRLRGNLTEDTISSGRYKKYLAASMLDTQQRC